MNSEPPTKRQKTAKKKTNQLPDVSVQMAVPLTYEDTEPNMEVEEEGGRRTARQCTLGEVPREFLPEPLRQKLDEEEREALEAEALQAQRDSKKAKAIAGVFIGAGIGMFLAYMLKDKIFGLAIKEVVEKVADTIVDEQ